jgi:hypothetical protein
LSVAPCPATERNSSSLTGEIGARAVDRIDDPHLLAPQSRRVVLGFLRKPAGLTDAQKALPQHRIDGDIGLAHRRGGALDPVRGLAAKGSQRHRAGFAHGQSEMIAQRHAVGVIGRQQ